MSGHWITWEWDGYDVRGRVHCGEPAGADCRLDYMVDGRECNVALFLDEDLPELGPWDSFIIGRTRIKAVWMGDHYEWERAQ